MSQIFIEKAFAKDKLIVEGKDEALDFTYIDDVANGFILAAMSDNAINEIFNIAHGKSHTLLDFITCLKRHFPDVDYDVIERDKYRPRRGTLSIDKARRLLGFTPSFSLECGIDSYVSYINSTKQHSEST